MMKKIILWILIISWMTAMFCLSHQEAVKSKKTSSEFIIAIVEFFDFSDSLSEIEKENIAEELTFMVRKGAHFCAYAVFGALLYFLFGAYEVKKIRQIIFSVGVSFLYACSDEYHQTFIKGRSGEVRDIVIDTLGALLGVLAIKLITTVIMKIKKKELAP